MTFDPFSGIPSYLGSVLGTGADGVITLDGVATFPGMNLTGGNIYTLTRDQQPTALTINAGITLKTAGDRVFCRGLILNNGTISYNGNPAAGATPGGALASGTLAGALAGATGTTAAGAAAATFAGAANSTVGASGAGGSGVSGAGGAGVNPTSASTTWWNTPYPLLTGTVGLFGTAKAAGGGLSGGSGAGDGTNNGGGGGSGGGTIGLICQQLINNGLISVNGGQGGNAATGNCGGGGGGGGGLVLIYSLIASILGTVSAAAGGSGTGIGSGTAGGPGAAGQTVNLVIT